MRVRSTYARQRIRHGLRHTAARAGQRSRSCVANGRLRHIRIGYARVSKADGSQSGTHAPGSNQLPARRPFKRPPDPSRLERPHFEDARRRSPRTIGRHVESLLVEVGQTIRHSGQDRRPVGLGQPLRPVPHSEVRQDAFGDVLSIRKVAGVVRNKTPSASWAARHLLPQILLRLLTAGGQSRDTGVRRDHASLAIGRGIAG